MANLTLTCRKISEMHMPLSERTRGNRFKLYMLDTGILMNLYERELVGEIVMGNMEVNSGAIAENAVVQALASQERTLYYYHNQNRQMEVDFVTIVDGTICAIEVKSENNGTCPSLNKAVKSKG